VAAAKKFVAEVTDLMIEGLLPELAHVVGAQLSEARQLQLMNCLSDEGVRRLDSVADETAGV
jgi:hypothetical protein